MSKLVKAGTVKPFQSDLRYDSAMEYRRAVSGLQKWEREAVDRPWCIARYNRTKGENHYTYKFQVQHTCVTEPEALRWAANRMRYTTNERYVVRKRGDMFPFRLYSISLWSYSRK